MCRRCVYHGRRPAHVSSECLQRFLFATNHTRQSIAQLHPPTETALPFFSTRWSAIIPRVAANRELIRRMEAKVKAAIDRVWGSTSDS